MIFGHISDKKGEQFWQATSIGLRPILPADENFFPFFCFCFVLSYVGYVPAPASDDLGILCFVWRCEFSLKFSFVTDEKSTFGRKVFGGPRSPKTK
jgi:hypothetical protein